MDTQYTVLSVRHWCGPRETVNFAEFESHGNYVPRTLGEARETVAAFERERYWLAHNEAFPPEYLIVPADFAEHVLQSGDFEPDWDGFAGACGGCGECNDCLAYIDSKAIECLRDKSAV